MAICLYLCLFVIVCPCVLPLFTYVHFLMQVNEQLREVLAQEQKVQDIGEPCTVQKVRRCSLVFIYLRFDLFIEIKSLEIYTHMIKIVNEQNFLDKPTQCYILYIRIEL